MKKSASPTQVTYPDYGEILQIYRKLFRIKTYFHRSATSKGLKMLLAMMQILISFHHESLSRDPCICRVKLSRDNTQALYTEKAFLT